MIEASEAWHEPRRRDRLDADLQLLGLRDAEFCAKIVPLSWLPLIAGFKIAAGTFHHGLDIGGLSFAELTTPQQLIDEGQKMDHCVGGYSSRCLSSEGAIGNHILHLSGRNGEDLSTLHIKRIDAPQKNQVTISTHFSFHNHSPSNVALAAGRWLAEKLNNGGIKEATTPQERLAHRQKLADSKYKTEQSIGYDARNPEVLAAAFALVRSTFPNAWKQYRNGLELEMVACSDMSDVANQVTLRAVLANIQAVQPAPVVRLGL